MHFSRTAKMEIIRLLEGSDLGIKRSIKELGISKSTF
jgi:predicted DNA-binding protein (UPF0251 family)